MMLSDAELLFSPNDISWYKRHASSAGKRDQKSFWAYIPAFNY